MKYDNHFDARGNAGSVACSLVHVSNNTATKWTFIPNNKAGNTSKKVFLIIIFYFVVNY